MIQRIKKIICYTLLSLLCLYTAAALTLLNGKDDEAVCERIEVLVEGDRQQSIITPAEITAILKRNKIDPQGKKTGEISCAQIEELIRSNPLIEKCECYKTHANVVCIKVRGRVPVLHVFSTTKGEFYVDDKGCIIKGVHKPFYLPVATGYIDEDTASGPLCEFAKFLGSDKFWNAQIEQIQITRQRHVELVPRVGDHTICMNSLNDAPQKLGRLREFYVKGLNTVGWNKYKAVNIEFNNQIICTKK